MVLEFLLSFEHLNLSSLFEEKKKEMVQKSSLKVIKVMKIFEYRKSNNRYWDKPKLHHLIIIKVFFIAEAFYLDYSLLFLFDNATSHSIYTQNVLHIANMNKEIEGKKLILRDKCYKKDGV